MAFVRYGVAQQNLTAAYDLVTPEFRGGTTRDQWRKALRRSTPIRPSPAGSARTGASTTRIPDDVGVALMLSSTHPRKVGQVIFHAELLKHRGRWLVDAFTPVATFTPIGVGRQHETGPATSPVARGRKCATRRQP